ncbi:MAG: AvaI/BsoBI family type II restriction endonuclease, partial [Asticcacaulis sp.]
MPLPHHISAAADLVTPQSEIRAGFIRMALEKNERGAPHIQTA